MTRSFRAVAVAFPLSFCLSSVASAQVPPQSAGQSEAQAKKGTPSVENLEALATTLQSPEQRQQLISRIEALIAVQKELRDSSEPEGMGARLIAALTATTGARRGQGGRRATGPDQIRR